MADTPDPDQQSLNTIKDRISQRPAVPDLEDRVLKLAEHYLKISLRCPQRRRVERQVYIDLMVALGHEYNDVLADLELEGQ
jgi:hypothetical protein